MNNYNDRFKDAPWFENSEKETIFMIGAGGIASNTMYNLIKTIPNATYKIADFDKVEAYNIGTQFFKTNQKNLYKVDALHKSLLEYNDNLNMLCYITPYDNHMYAPIMITGLDNMAARKQAYEVWKSKSDRKLFIDGRMKANLYEVYAVIPGREEQYEATLFSDDEAEDGPCTFKQTAYVGMLIGGRITQFVVNYLTNLYAKEDICEVPFSFKESTELFYITQE
jgi:molybdopterin-synthase adenylyltransferase